jgi:hypothetical protein
MRQNKSYNEWLSIHNRAARDYMNSEWSTEVFLGVAKKRKALFSKATGNVLDVGCRLRIRHQLSISEQCRPHHRH